MDGDHTFHASQLNQPKEVGPRAQAPRGSPQAGCWASWPLPESHTSSLMEVPYEGCHLFWTESCGMWNGALESGTLQPREAS